jgi:hypothetical protein
MLNISLNHQISWPYTQLSLTRNKEPSSRNSITSRYWTIPNYLVTTYITPSPNFFRYRRSLTHTQGKQGIFITHDGIGNTKPWSWSTISIIPQWNVLDKMVRVPCNFIKDLEFKYSSENHHQLKSWEFFLED